MIILDLSSEGGGCLLRISQDRSGIAAVCRHMSEATIQTKRQEREETDREEEEATVSLCPFHQDKYLGACLFMYRGIFQRGGVLGWTNKL